MTVTRALADGTSNIHKEIESLDYLLRYKTEHLTLEDHYLHLCQLRAIYIALEKTMKHTHFSPVLPTELYYLLQRSDEIRKDIYFLEPTIQASKRNTVLTSTQTYIDTCLSINYTGIKSKEELNQVCEAVFAHFITRLLGDLYGGRKLRQYVQQLYLREGSIQDTHSKLGISFYCFDDPGTLRKFKLWIDTLKVDEKALVTNATIAFEQHGLIFRELEEKRTGPAHTFNARQVQVIPPFKPKTSSDVACPLGFSNPPAQQTPPKKCPVTKLTQYTCNFFTARNALALTAGAAILGVGLASNYYLKHSR